MAVDDHSVDHSAISRESLDDTIRAILAPEVGTEPSLHGPNVGVAWREVAIAGCVKVVSLLRGHDASVTSRLQRGAASEQRDE